MYFFQRLYAAKPGQKKGKLHSSGGSARGDRLVDLGWEDPDVLHEKERASGWGDKHVIFVTI